MQEHTHEDWRPVTGHEDYEVSSLGRIRSWKARKTEPLVMKPRLQNAGYLFVTFSEGNVKVNRLVHHVVLEEFVGPRPEGHEGAHFNGDRFDNRLANLRWATPHQNAKDTIRLGRTNRGRKMHLNRLDENQVRWVRRELAAGRTKASVAKELGVSHGCIGGIQMGTSWAWLT